VVSLLQDEDSSVVKTPEQVEKMRASATLLSQCLRLLVERALPGVSGLELDVLAEEFIRDHGAIPAFKNYGSAPGFPGSICFSRNDVVVHGIPAASDIIEDRDIITIDSGLSLDGWFADAARLIEVGKTSEEDTKLVAASRAALQAGIDACRVGNTLGDVSFAIQLSIGLSRYYNVIQFCGHAIGQKMHEAPRILNCGIKGTGIPLQTGMVFCLEPILLKKKSELGLRSDKWTVVTLDGSRATHIEQMVLVTDGEPEILSA